MCGYFCTEEIKVLSASSDDVAICCTKLNKCPLTLVQLAFRTFGLMHYKITFSINLLRNIQIFFVIRENLFVDIRQGKN